MRPLVSSSPTEEVLHEVLGERRRQYEKFGDQSRLPLGFGGRGAFSGLAGVDWVDVMSTQPSAFADDMRERVQDAGDDLTYEKILTEEYAELLAESEPERIRQELLQLAAVCVQVIEAIDRRAER